MTQSDSFRWLTHRIVIDGEEHGMSIATIECRDGLWHVDIEKFTKEIHSTAFHSGTIRITTDKDMRIRPTLEFF